MPSTDDNRPDAERLALEAALAEARSDPRPDIPHEEVREEIGHSVFRERTTRDGRDCTEPPLDARPPGGSRRA